MLLRTARITGIFQPRSILQGGETHEHPGLYIWIILLINATKEESRVEGRDWGEGREEGEEEAVATKVSISVFFTPL